MRRVPSPVKSRLLHRICTVPEKSVSERSEAVPGGAQEPRVPLLK